MKVTVKYSGARNDPGEDYEARCEVLINGEEFASVGNFSDCCEDANLGRDLNFVYGLAGLLTRAHEAGMRGEAIEIEHMENSED